MSLRLAALDAYTAFNAIMAPGWLSNANRIDDCLNLISDARWRLRYALGISPLYVEDDRDLDALGLLETLAARLSRDPETALLAGAIIRAIGQHRAETLTKTILAAE